MPHIHTAPGQNDVCVNVFIVNKNRVLLRLHEKYNIWLPPGGHVELDEVPEDAAIREAKEEVGLDIELWTEMRAPIKRDILASEYRELVPPAYMNIHRISDTHNHLVLMYFATSVSDHVEEPDTYEKSGGCLWLSREKLMAHPEVDESTKYYGSMALEILAA